MKKMKNRLLALAMVAVMLLSNVGFLVTYAAGDNLISDGVVNITDLTIKNSKSEIVGQSGSDVLGHGYVYRVDFKWDAPAREKLEVGEWFEIDVNFGAFTPKATSLTGATIDHVNGGQLQLSWVQKDAASGLYAIRLTVSEEITGSSGTISGTAFTEFSYEVHVGKTGEPVEWSFGGTLFHFREGEYPTGYYSLKETPDLGKGGGTGPGQSNIMWAITVNAATKQFTGDLTITDLTKDHFNNLKADTHKIVPLKKISPKLDDNPDYSYKGFERPIFGSEVGACSPGEGYFGIENIAYFQIYTVDRGGLKTMWEADGEYWTKDGAGNNISPNPSYDPAYTSDNFLGMLSTTAVWKDWLDGDHTFDSKYNYSINLMKWRAKEYTPLPDAAVKSITINSDGHGFNIVLDGNMVSDKEIFIVYCTEILPGETQFGNQVSVTGGLVSGPSSAQLIVTSAGGTVTAANDGIVLKKVDSDSELINKNAAFTITRYEEGSLTPTASNGSWNISTGTAGQVASTTLYPSANHYYKLEETAAPEGYDALTAPVYFKLVSATGDTYTLVLGTIDGSGNFTVASDAYPNVATAISETRTLTITNKATDTAPAPTTITLGATKALGGVEAGRPNLSELADKFTFVLKDSSGNTLDTKKNDTLGVVTFKTLDLTEAKTYTFKISETPNTDGTRWTYDSKEVIVTVVVGKIDGTNNLEVKSTTYTLAGGGTTTTTFTNAFIAAGTTTLDLTATKRVEGTDAPALVANQFSFEVYKEGDASFAPITAKNDAHGSITFADVPITGTSNVYQIRETTASTAQWSHANTVYTVTIPATLNPETNAYVAGAPVYSISGEPKEPIFTNTYTKTTSAEVTLEASKALSGDHAPALADVTGDFEFELYEKNNATAIETVPNAADGKITFPPIEITAAGNYEYTIKETNPGAPWDYDDTIYTVTFTASYDETLNKITVTTPVYSVAGVPTSPVFTNGYLVPGTSTILTAKKTVEDNAIALNATRSFEFQLSGEGLDTPLTAWTNAGGIATFDAINYTAEGTYNYTLKETANNTGVPATENWDFDTTTEYDIKVEVEPAVNNTTGLKELRVISVEYKLKTEDTYKPYTAGNSVPEIMNKFTPAPTGDVKIAAQKNIVSPGIDNTRTAGLFEFTLYKNDVKVGDATTNAADGSIEFNLGSYSAPVTETYTIKETSVKATVDATWNAAPYNGNGTWTLDETVYTATVTVAVDPLDATKLKATVTYSKPGTPVIEKPIFENTLTPAPATATIVAKKTLESIGLQLTEGLFTFQLFDEFDDTNPIHQVTNGEIGAIGDVTFPELTYTYAEWVGKLPKTFTYTIQELVQAIDTAGEYVFDTVARPVTVTVKLNEAGDALVAEVKYDGEATPPIFENKFTPAPAKANLSAYKRTTGATMGAGQFTFSVYNSDNEIIRTATNKFSGTSSIIEFPEIEYTAEDVHTYTIKETTTHINSAGAWVFDKNVYTVTVNVHFNDKKDALIADVMYGDTATPPTFTNIYVPPYVPEDTTTAATTPGPVDSTTPPPADSTTPAPEDSTTPAPEVTTTVPEDSTTPAPEDTTTTTPEDTTTAEVTIPNPEDPTPEDELPRFTRSQVPDPNDPNSPEEFILVNGLGIPLGIFRKVEQPDGTFLYVDLDGVPLGAGTPATGDNALKLIISALLSASMIGIIIFLTYTQKNKKRKRT